MKFPTTNPFAIPTAYRQMRFLVPLEAALAVEDAFAEGALSVASFESPEDEALWNVTILTETLPTPREMQAAQEHLQQTLGIAIPEPVIEDVPMRDWLSAVARDFPPMMIGRFFVHGAHAKEQIPVHALPLQVEAGMAFGSGEHATTRGCLLMLSALHRRRRISRVLDMGCGSGILGIAAAKLWPGAVVLGVDSDATSVKVAHENIVLNRAAPRMRALHGNGYASAEVSRGGPYALIVANILARPLVAMARSLRIHLDEGGVAILSGLLDTQSAMVIAAHRRQGLRLRRRYVEAGWATLVMEG